MTDIILVDSHGVGYAAQQAMKLSVGSRETQAVFGSLKKVREYVAKLHARPIMLWDGHAQWRYDIYSGYKERRKEPSPEIQKMKEGFQNQKEDIKTAFRLLGVANIIDKHMEADDLAGVLSRKFSADKRRHVWLMSKDRDWQQLVTENVSWVCHKTDTYCKHGNFLDITGYATPIEFLQGKALQGDTSDEIPGVGQIGEKSAVELMAMYRSVPAMIAALREKLANGEKIPKAFERFINNEPSPKEAPLGRIDVFKRNMKLMNLIDSPEKPKSIQVDSQEPDLDEFMRFCRELNFQSIINDFDTFTRPFIEIR